MTAISKNMFWIGFVYLACLITGCTRMTPQQPLAATVAQQSVVKPIFEVRRDVYHEVGPAETLWRISKMYGVDQKAIMEANHLKDPSSIFFGQKLFIPQAATQRTVVPLYNTRPWSYIVIHHSATETGNALLLNHSHQLRGFEQGLGYHFLIDNGTLGKGLGQIEIGPRWVKQMDGAHCNAAGMNENGIGICLVGNFSEKRVSQVQLNSLAFLVNTLRVHYGIPLDHVIRHRDVPGKITECPGNYFPWEEFKRKLVQSQPVSS